MDRVARLGTILFFLVPVSAHGATPCFFLSVPCDARSGESAASDAVSGGAYSSFADMFNVNPASIPTFATPVGVEAIETQAGGAATTPNFNLALIKGYQNIGTAFTTDSDNTFYSYNLVQAYRGTSSQSFADQTLAAQSVMPSLNIGGAFAVVSDRIKKYSIPTLGLDLRYNKATHRLDPGYGLSINSEHLTLGLSRFTSATGHGVPGTSTTTYMIGLKYTKFQIEYTVLKLTADDAYLNDRYKLYSQPVGILTASLLLGRFASTLASRTAYDVNDQIQSTWLFTLQFRVTNHVALAGLHNYIPGTNSLGMQVFF